MKLGWHLFAPRRSRPTPLLRRARGFVAGAGGMLLPVLLASGCRPAEPAPDPLKLQAPAAPVRTSPLGPPPQRTIYRVGGEVTRPVQIEKCEPKLPEYLKKRRITHC